MLYDKKFYCMGFTHHLAGRICPSLCDRNTPDFNFQSVILAVIQ